MATTTSQSFENAHEQIMAIVEPYVSKQDLARIVIQSFGTLPANEYRRALADGNRTLAILGDNAAASVLARLSFIEGRSRGELDANRQQKLNNDRLASLCDDCGLSSLIICNPGTISISMKMKATAFEALLGAVEFESGRSALEEVMRRLNVM